LYGYKTSSLTPSEEHRWRVFENGVQGRIFRPKKEEGAKDGRRLHNEELQNVYASPNIIMVIILRRMKWV